MTESRKARRRVYNYAFAYGLAFALLYFLVFYLIPPASAVPILASCTTSLGSKAITIITSPISYFEILIFTAKYHVSSGYRLASLLVENFTVISVLLFLLFPYLNLWAIRLRKKLSPHKVVLAALIATFIFSAVSAIWTCGTGTSIIGFSFSALISVSMLMDFKHYQHEHFTTGKWPWLYIVGLALVTANAFGYLITNAPAHLFGGAIFLAVLLILEPNARKALWAKVKTKK
jgi:hypothetical protein